MRNKIVAPTLIMIFLVSVTVQVVKVSQANSIPLLNPPPALIVKIDSPMAGGRYSQDHVAVSFTLEFPNYPGYSFGYPHGDITGVNCYLDKQDFIPCSGSGIHYTAVVEELSEGWHNITVEANCEHLSKGFAKAIFMVDTIAPTISVYSPQNTTYATTDILLEFKTSEGVKWTGYSLDEKRTVTVDENTTLTELPLGSHSLAVYANDTVENSGTSETVYFTIAEKKNETPASQPEPIPTFLVTAISAASLAVVALAGMIYLKKRKPSSSLVTKKTFQKLIGSLKKSGR